MSKKKPKKRPRRRLSTEEKAKVRIKRGLHDPSKNSNDKEVKNDKGDGWGSVQIGRESFSFLVVCVIAQLVTVLITWSAWEIRDSPVNIPWVSGTPQFSCGFLMLASLAAVLFSPRRYGMLIHLFVLFIAITMDQFRCQPQILAITILMAACVWPKTRQLCVWFLVSMWLWAGLHKVLSPDWFGNVSVHVLGLLQVEVARQIYWWFALVVAVSEISLGLIGIAKPRLAALGCVALHLGITVFVALINWNFSVIPWNLCTAIVGTWLLLTVKAKHSWLELPNSKIQTAIVVAFLVVPAGVYFGWVRHSFAHVLYSGNLPIAAITREPGEVEPLEGWGNLSIPFPHEKKAFLDFFQLSGKPGQKLHIFDCRTGLESQFYEFSEHGEIDVISEAKFFSGSIPGIACDDRRKICELELAHTRMLTRSAVSMIYAVEFDTKHFQSELLEDLQGLPNLEQVQLKGCRVQAKDLINLIGLPRLAGVGLNDTKLEREDLKSLEGISTITLIEFENKIYRSLDGALNDIPEQ